MGRSPVRWQPGWPSPLGPVFFYDLVRSSRRRQFLLFRTLYGGLLLSALLFVYASLVYGQRHQMKDVFVGVSLDRNQLADFAANFFLAFLGIQFAAACLITPAFTAGALAEDKESHALEFLLATDLRSREIIVGVAVSRLASLLLLMATGLPVLSLVQFLGGIDPDLLFAAFVLTGMSMVSLTSLGVLQSVYARHHRQAVLRTYGLALVYLAVSGLSWLLLLPQLGWGNFPSSETWTSPVTVGDLVQWLNAGNPVTVIVLGVLEVRRGGDLDVLLPGLAGGFALAHGIAAVFFLAWATWRLRAVVMAEWRWPARMILPGFRRRFRPRIGDRPMLWKELFAQPGSRLRSLDRIGVGILVPATFLPALGIAYFALLFPLPTTSPEQVAEYYNTWIRVTGTVLACAMLLSVALRAAGSVAIERDRATLDGMLTTPLSTDSILWSKALGSILGPRWAWLWLGLVWGIGVVSGALTAWVPFLFVIIWLVLAAFGTALGLWFSLACRTTQRAILATLLALAGFGVGHWLLWLVVAPVSSWLTGVEHGWRNWIDFQAVGLTPPLTFFLLSVPSQGYGPWTAGDWAWVLPLLIRGLVLWSLGAVFFWNLARRRLRQIHEPIIDSPARAAAGWPRRLRRAATLGVVGLVVAWCFRDPAEGQLREALAEADRLDPGWRTDELEARRRVVPDEDNGALQVPLIPDDRNARWAPKWYPGKRWPSQDLDEILGDLQPETPLTEKQVEALTRNLKEVESALDEARRMVDYPYGRTPVEYAKDGFSTLLPYVQKGRTVAGLLSYDCLLRTHDGDFDGALDDCRAILNTARRIGDEPFYISQLVRMACNRIALNQLTRILAQGQPSSAALERVQKALELEEPEPLFLIGSRGERAMLDQFMVALEEGEVSSISMQFIAGDAKITWLNQFLLRAGFGIRAQRAALLHFSNRVVEMAKLPWEERGELLDQLEREAKELPAGVRGVLGEQLDSNIGRMADRHRQACALLRCAIATVACERYRRQQGHWPGALEELRPTYLQMVPIDPFDGRPLRYRRLADGVVVYTTGPDRQDDGGNLSTRVIPNDPKQPGFYGVDLGYRLWDVGQRRTRLATPAANDARPR